MLTKEIIKIFEDSKSLYGAGKIQLILKSKNINTDKKTILKIMSENKLVKELQTRKRNRVLTTKYEIIIETY